MVFLRRLAAEHWDGISPPPESTVHSANPVGKMNIISFMDSWRRSSSFIQGLGPLGAEISEAEERGIRWAMELMYRAGLRGTRLEDADELAERMRKEGLR
jgi:hypothetical protein